VVTSYRRTFSHELPARDRQCGWLRGPESSS